MTQVINELIKDFLKIQHNFRNKLRDEFREDVNVIFHNCEIFNEDDSKMSENPHTTFKYSLSPDGPS